MLTDKQKIENVMNLFLEWNIGDARKAGHWLPFSWESIDRVKTTDIHPTYDGGAMVGAVILAMCVIQSVSQFSRKDEQFKWFIDKYMKPIDESYDGAQIYALRCSLIKNYALIASVSESGVKNPNPKKIPFAITDEGNHFEASEYGVLFNAKTFIIHIQLATQKFFTEILIGELPEEYKEAVIKYHDTMKIGQISNVSK